ncbi:uncharacterized protein LOC108101770 [Drosophila ficusphila]|uniref:uncharacterized protein LOC108101770 n=1 Tax=Drosophila ficusphila TaxID=30025 RepID=UPI0007E7ED60|nr:uncharacterized protein LOC108101770 [Drosophila ficusphila]
MDPSATEPRDYLLDEEMDLLAELGDCHKTKLEDIDVIARTTDKCQALSYRMISFKSQEPDRPTIELEDTDSAEPESDLMPYGLAEEEEQSSDEETKTLRAIHALDQILNRIEMMQSQIRRRQQHEGSCDEQSGEEQREEQVDCSGLTPKQAEIRCVQRAQHHMQCQVSELLCRYDKLRSMMRTLSQQWAHLNCQIAEIRAHNLVHLEWTQESASDLSNCQQRHRSLAAVKLTKKMALLVTKTNMSSGFRYSRRYLRQALLERHINDFHYEIAELKLLSDEINAQIELRLDGIRDKAIQMGLFAPPTPRFSTLVAEASKPFTVPKTFIQKN